MLSHFFLHVIDGELDRMAMLATYKLPLNEKGKIELGTASLDEAFIIPIHVANTGT
jgi:hypothetical protein